MIHIKVEKMTLRSCGNTPNPHKPFKQAYDYRHETQEEAKQRYVDWLSTKVIGDPCASERFTTQQLKSMGYVGVYCTTIDDFARLNPECVVQYTGWLELPPFPL